MAQTFKFLVPPDLAPGVYRQHVGFYPAGGATIFTWPDGATVKGEVLSKRLVPLDEDSRKLLEQMHPKHLAELRPVPRTQAKETVADAGAVEEAGKYDGRGEKPAKGKAADK